MKNNRQSLQVWTRSLTVRAHSYFLQCVTSLFVAFEAVNTSSKERVFNFTEDVQSNACLWDVRCADYKNRNKKGGKKV